MNSTKRMSLDEYFGEECAQSIKELLLYAIRSDTKERANLVEIMREDAGKQQSATVRRVILKIADLVESMTQKQEPTSSANEVSHDIDNLYKRSLTQ